MSKSVGTKRTAHIAVPAARLTYRYLTGMELDGVKRTDATWRTRGRDLRHGVHDAWPWHYLPRAQRCAWRNGLTVGFFVLCYTAVVAPSQTWVGVQAIAVLAFAVFLHWMWNRLQGFRTKHRWIGPLSVVLGKRWNVDPLALVPGITVPADCRTNADHPVEVILPADYREPDRQQEASAKLIARKVKIPVTAMDFEIDHEGDHPKMLVRAMEVPPEFVDFDMAREYMEQATDTNLFLGFGLRTAPVWCDLNQESPHWACSFGSGGGKSTFCRMVAAQVRRQRSDNRIVILDFGKDGDSHADWVYDEHGNLLPGIEFHTTVEAGHDALVELAAERARRSRAAFEAKRYRRPEPDFGRVLVIFEEMNTSIPKLEGYWKDIRGTEDPKESPAMTAWGNLVCTGRATKMNCLAVAQRFDAKVAGGGDVRANFMIRILSRFDPSAIKMLIPEIKPAPKSSNHPGRMTLAIGGEAVSFQGVYMTPDETRDWSSEGRPMVIDHAEIVSQNGVMPAQGHAPDLGEVSESGARALRLVPPVEPVVELVTLAAAIEQGLVPGTLDALRKASQKDDFPTAHDHRGGARRNAGRYAAHDLADWARTSRRVNA